MEHPADARLSVRTTVSQPAALIAALFEQLAGIPFVTPNVFGDTSPTRIADALQELCVRLLGSGVEQAEFIHASAGSVHGLVLANGRRVVVKVHPPATSSRYLRAMQSAQRQLVSDRFPCPAPLAGPAPIGCGVAVVESLLDHGEWADAHDRAVRRAMADALATLVRRLRSFVGLDSLRRGPMTVREGRLWPRPHSPRFDFEATSAGAEWIDAAAARARRVLETAPSGDWVVGHTDWRVQNLRFADGAVSAAYDWDSLSVEREPVLVGLVARGFTADWSRRLSRQLPTLDESLGFVRDYEAARGHPFGPDEHRVVRAALTYRMAYTARCEHSDLLTDFGRRAPRAAESRNVPAHTARAFLAEHAAALLSHPVEVTPSIAADAVGEVRPAGSVISARRQSP